MTDEEKPRRKASHVGVPAIFELELACKHINEAYGGHFGCYLVGSALVRPDWRDVDVVLIMDDEAFKREFPKTTHATFEFDPKWLINSIAISQWLSRRTGLPVDFKIQPQTWANDRHKGQRNALGLKFIAES